MTNYVAIDIGGTNIKYGLIDQEGQLVESHEVANEAHKGGPHILQKTKEIVASYLEKGAVAGVAISSAGMVNPEVVILGGGIMGQEAILKPKIRKALKDALVPSLADKTKLEFAHHQNTAGMLGAYYHFRTKQD